MNQFKISFRATLVVLILSINTGLIGQDTDLPKTTSGEQANKVDLDEQPEKDEKIGIPNLLFSGVLFRNQEKRQSWYLPSLFELFPPNTIEGFVFNPSVSFTQHLKDGKFYQFKPNLRYGFGNQRFQAQLSTQFYYAPSRKASIQLSGGRFVEEFNQESTLGAFNNTYYTFLREENFLKIYERSYLEVSHAFAPVKDFFLTTTLSWNDRKPLQNLPDFDKEDRDFTSNAPLNDELPNTEFEQHQALLWKVQLRWQLGHQLVYHQGKLKSVSHYPALSISYSGALSDVLGSDLSYQRIAFQLSEHFETKKWGAGKFLLETGGFLAKDELSFVDFKHFNGRRTVYGEFRIGDFQLLDYYQYSTTDFYLQSHYEHQWNTISIRGGQSKIQPVTTINYLYTPAMGSYWELGVGAKLFKLWRLDFYNSWRGSQHESFGVRLGLALE